MQKQKLKCKNIENAVGVAPQGDPNNKFNAITVGANCVRQKNHNGITLIALIITIIVMLILVGVTINVALNGGLFVKGKDAKNDTLREMDREELYSAVIASYDTTTNKILRDKLISNLGEEWNVSNENAPWICKSKNQNVFKVLENGKIEDENSDNDNQHEGSGVLSLTNKNIGDYIDLGNNIVGTNATTDDWRLLYVDENEGKAYIILADYLPNEYVNEKGQTIKLAEDAGLRTNDEFNVSRSSTVSNFIDTLLDTSKWISLANGIEGASVIGSPTPQMMNNSIKLSYGLNDSELEIFEIPENDTLYEFYFISSSDFWLSSIFPEFNPEWYDNPLDEAVSYDDILDEWIFSDLCIWQLYYMTYCVASDEFYPIRPVISVPLNSLNKDKININKISYTLTNENIGDYVDIGNNIVRTSATTDDWRVFYVDETEGKIYLKLADFLPNSTGVAQAAGFEAVGEYDISCGSMETQEVLDLLSDDNPQNYWISLTNSIKGARAFGTVPLDLLNKSISAKLNREFSISNSNFNNVIDVESEYDLSILYGNYVDGFILIFTPQPIVKLEREHVGTLGDLLIWSYFELSFLTSFYISPVISIPYDCCIKVINEVCTVMN